MIAAIPDSTYLENPVQITGEEVYVAQSTLLCTMPDMGLTNGSTTGFTSTYETTVGDAILIYNSEYPEGIETVADAVTPGSGTWYVEIPATLVLSFPITKATWINAYPETLIDGTNDAMRLMPFDTPLTYVSSLETEYVGTSDRDGMLTIGDELGVELVADTVIQVVLTDCVIADNGDSTFTYTCTFAAETTAPLAVDAIISARAINPGKVVTRTGDDAVVTTAKLYNPAPNEAVPTWNMLQRQIVSPEGIEITEPFTLDYYQGIVTP